MTPWQKRARLVVAAVGIASAVVVYAGIGRRKTATPAPAIHRLDPKAILETTAGLLQQVRGTKQDFSVQSERQLTYDNGSTRLLGVRISVKNRDGRDFVVTAKEASSGEHEKTLQLSGDVHLSASDGFQLVTDKGSFSQDDGIVRADGAIQFGRGGMRGSGTGMTYDKNRDVLTIAQDAQVTVTGADGKTTMDFHAGAASLDRVQDVLVVDGMVHVVRDAQVIETDQATAHMDDRDELVKTMELRGNSRVEGGSDAFDSMSARDINLYYSDDGQMLQHVALAGGAAVALAAKNGSSGGRQFMAETLDLQLAADGSIEHGSGQDKFAMVLPAGGDLPARRIQSDQFDSRGEAGKGLTEATFTGNVVYREEAKKGTAVRTARAHDLRVAMNGDAIGAAEFNGAVTFDEQGLKATGGQAHYMPDAGTLALARGNGTANPMVVDDKITIEGQTIDVALESRRMSAAIGVKTTLQAGGGGKSGEGAAHLPGLLKQDQPAHVNADGLEYDGSANHAVYTGNASLWQGETAVRADRLTIDQATGDLIATGTARANLVLDNGTSASRADDIRYDDAKHVITYAMTPRPVPTAAPARPGGATASPAAAAAAPVVPAAPVLAQMSGPQGDLSATHIEAFLADGGGALRQLVADGSVSLKLDTRRATGGHLTYFADGERYVMTGTAAAPVTVVEACRESTGKTLTFFKSTDRIIVDGNEEIRTQTKSGGACPQPLSR